MVVDLIDFLETGNMWPEFAGSYPLTYSHPNALFRAKVPATIEWSILTGQRMDGCFDPLPKEARMLDCLCLPSRCSLRANWFCIGMPRRATNWGGEYAHPA